MRTLLDTNILLRSIQSSSPDHGVALGAVANLLRADRELVISSQTVYEFLAVATRSVADNGLGMPHGAADAGLAKLVAAIGLLCDSAAVVSETRRLVLIHKVIGKKVHDARLVATMNVEGVKKILTFNGGDFARYQGISVLAPVEVAIGKMPSIA